MVWTISPTLRQCPQASFLLFPGAAATSVVWARNTSPDCWLAHRVKSKDGQTDSDDVGGMDALETAYGTALHIFSVSSMEYVSIV